MKEIWQGDIFDCLRKLFGYKNKELAYILEDNIGVNKSMGENRISEIINGRAKGIIDLDTTTFYNEFVEIKLFGKTEDDLDVLLNHIKNYVEDNGLFFDGYEGREGDTFKSYTMRMLSNGLSRIEKTYENPLMDCTAPKPKSMPVLKKQRTIKPDNFTGREDLLNSISEKLQNDSVVVLQGIGGIGKTTLCEKYIYDHRKDYKYIQKIRYGKNNPSFKEMIADLVFENLNDEKWDENERYERKKALLEKSDNSVLIFFDNVDKEPEDMKVFKELIINSSIHIIVTTRLNECFDDGITVHVSPLSEQDQIGLFEKYLQRRIKESEIESVKQLLKLVEGHTLMITILASIIRKKAMRINKALNLFTEDPDKLSSVNVHVKKDDENFTGNTNSIMEWLYEYSSLAEDQKSAFFKSVFLPAEGVSREFILGYILDDYIEAIDSLVNSSWIEASPEADSIKLHPIIRTFAMPKMQPELENNLDLFDKLYSSTRDSEVTEDFADDLCRLINSSLEIMEFDDSFNDDNLKKLLAMAAFCYENYKYKFTEKIYKKAVNVIEQGSATSFTNEGLITLYTKCGEVYQRLAEYSNAIIYFKKAIELLKDERNERLGECYRKLGEVLRKASNYEEALKWDNAALEVYREIGTDDVQLSIAEATNAIGVLYLNMGETEKAFTAYLDALNLREKYGAKPRELAFSYHNIGTAYHRNDDFEKALEYHKKGLEIRQQNNLNETDIAASMTWIGNDYTKLGKFDEGRKYIDDALKKRENILGKRHPEYAWTLSTLCDWFEARGDYEMALKTIDEVIEIRNESLGKEHKYTKDAVAKKEDLEAKL